MDLIRFQKPKGNSKYHVEASVDLTPKNHYNVEWAKDIFVPKMAQLTCQMHCNKFKMSRNTHLDSSSRRQKLVLKQTFQYLVKNLSYICPSIPVFK